MERNYGTADLIAWPGSAWLQLSFSPFPVWYPVYRPRYCNMISWFCLNCTGCLTSPKSSRVYKFRHGGRPDKLAGKHWSSAFVQSPKWRRADSSWLHFIMRDIRGWIHLMNDVASFLLLEGGVEYSYRAPRIIWQSLCMTVVCLPKKDLLLLNIIG